MQILCKQIIDSYTKRIKKIGGTAVLFNQQKGQSVTFVYVDAYKGWIKRTGFNVLMLQVILL